MTSFLTLVQPHLAAFSLSLAYEAMGLLTLGGHYQSDNARIRVLVLFREYVSYNGSLDWRCR